MNIAKFLNLFNFEKKARFDFGEEVTAGSVTVWTVKKVKRIGKEYYYKLVNANGEVRYPVCEGILDRVYATRFTGENENNRND